MPKGEPRDASPLFPKMDAREIRALGPKRFALHQRGRILAAMVAAVDTFGYSATTVEILVKMAGVSKNVFYREFADKESCFLAAFDEIVERGGDRIEAALDDLAPPGERLAAAFRAFVELATEYPPAGRLVFLASLELGFAAVEARVRAGARFEAILARSFGESADAGPAPPLLLRAIVGGTREVVYRRLRADDIAGLKADIDPLIGWALGYRDAVASQRKPRGATLLSRLPATAEARPNEMRSWQEPPSSVRSRRELSQRERIVRATAQIAAEKGYAALGIAAISQRAGTSNQTFYENFASKEEAFLVAFDSLALQILSETQDAFVGPADWLSAGPAGISALLDRLTRDPLTRQLVLFELTAAGPEGRGRAEVMLDLFIGFLEPEELPRGLRRPTRRVILEAIAGGIWAVVEHEVAVGRGSSLTELAPTLIDFVLVPFGG